MQACLLHIVALALLWFFRGGGYLYVGLRLRLFSAFARLHCLRALDDLSLPLGSCWFGCFSARELCFAGDGDLARSI